MDTEKSAFECAIGFFEYLHGSAEENEMVTEKNVENGGQSAPDHDFLSECHLGNPCLCVLAQRQNAFNASVLMSEVLTKIFNPRAKGLALDVNEEDYGEGWDGEI